MRAQEKKGERGRKREGERQGGSTCETERGRRREREREREREKEHAEKEEKERGRASAREAEKKRGKIVGAKSYVLPLHQIYVFDCDFNACIDMLFFFERNQSGCLLPRDVCGAHLNVYRALSRMYRPLVRILGSCDIPATHCNTLQHTATHCNTLHHSATH